MPGGPGLQIFCGLLSGFCLFLAIEGEKHPLIWVALVPWFQALLNATGALRWQASTSFLVGFLFQGAISLQDLVLYGVEAKFFNWLATTVLTATLFSFVGIGVGLASNPIKAIHPKASGILLTLILIPILDTVLRLLFDSSWKGLWWAIPLEGDLIQCLSFLGWSGMTLLITAINLAILGVFNIESQFLRWAPLTLTLLALASLNVMGGNYKVESFSSSTIDIGIIKEVFESEEEASDYFKELTEAHRQESAKENQAFLLLSSREQSPREETNDSQISPVEGSDSQQQTFQLSAFSFTLFSPKNVSISPQNIRKQSKNSLSIDLPSSPSNHLVSFLDAKRISPQRIEDLIRRERPKAIILSIPQPTFNGEGLPPNSALTLRQRDLLTPITLLAIRHRTPLLLVQNTSGVVALANPKGETKILLSRSVEASLWIDLPLTDRATPQ